jgi:GNAT superfamily N-acetyltransferase
MTRYHVEPATPDRWHDLQSLFGEKGAYAGCWCMFWRLNRAEFKAARGNGTKQILQQMVDRNEVPGLLAYDLQQERGKNIVGWCSLGPREDFLALENSRILKRVDDQKVWSIVCFYVAKPARRSGLMLTLLEAAKDYARAQGAKLLEGYPIDLQANVTGYAGYMGFASAYRNAGFVEVGRASDTQLIMRCDMTLG